MQINKINELKGKCREDRNAATLLSMKIAEATGKVADAVTAVAEAVGGAGGASGGATSAMGSMGSMGGASGGGGGGGMISTISSLIGLATNPTQQTQAANIGPSFVAGSGNMFGGAGGEPKSGTFGYIAPNASTNNQPAPPISIAANQQPTFVDKLTEAIPLKGTDTSNDELPAVYIDLNGYITTAPGWYAGDTSDGITLYKEFSLDNRYPVRHIVTPILIQGDRPFTDKDVTRAVNKWGTPAQKAQLAQANAANTQANTTTPAVNYPPAPIKQPDIIQTPKLPAYATLTPSTYNPSPFLQVWDPPSRKSNFKYPIPDWFPAYDPNNAYTWPEIWQEQNEVINEPDVAQEFTDALYSSGLQEGQKSGQQLAQQGLEAGKKAAEFGAQQAKKIAQDNINYINSQQAAQDFAASQQYLNMIAMNNQNDMGNNYYYQPPGRTRKINNLNLFSKY